MLTQSKGFLTIWHGLKASGRPEWERWHTVEHMPERLGLPGFLIGRRYMNDTSEGQCCFTLYEASDIAIFKSAPYLERLNNPSPWTAAVAKTFTNLTRGACRRIARAGFERSYGGAMLTIRLVREPGFKENDNTLDSLQKIADELSKIDGVTEVNVGLSDTTITQTETKERALRKGTGESSLDGVIAVEGYEYQLLLERAEKIRETAEGAGLYLSTEIPQVHNLSYLLFSND